MRLALLALFSIVLRCFAQDAIISEIKDERTLIQVRVVHEAASGLAGMEREARRFLDDLGRARVLSRLSVYSRRDVAEAQNGGMCEGSYLSWKAHYDAFPKAAFMASDVTSIGGDSVLRLRARDGTVTRQVVRGKDPTQIVVDGVRFELLFVSGRLRSRFEGCGVPGTVDPVLFLQTDATLNLAICQRVTSWLANKLGVNHVWTHFRNDRWFICSQFPVMFPFLSAEPLPSSTFLASSREYSCSIFCEGPPRCM
jgi:hypothetical protein